jgi:hypothetical protein
MIASSERTGGRPGTGIESIRLLMPDVTLVDGRYKPVGAHGGKLVIGSFQVLTVRL